MDKRLLLFLHPCRNCRESDFGVVDDDMTTLNNQLSNINSSRGVCNQVSVDRPILSISGSSSRRSSWCEIRENMINSDAIEDAVPPSFSSTCLDRSISLDCAASLVVLASASSSMLSSSPGGSSITSTSSGNSGSSSVGTFSSSGESCVSIGKQFVHVVVSKPWNEVNLPDYSHWITRQ